MSIEMHIAPGTSSMRRRYRGSRASAADLRIFDARTMPPAVEVGGPGGVDVTWVDRPAGDAGVIMFLHGGGDVSGPDADHWE